MKADGFTLVTESLLAHGVQDFFYIIGGPTTKTMQYTMERVCEVSTYAMNAPQGLLPLRTAAFRVAQVSS